ncbi:MAG: helix-turn-helix transcriptional regulator [Clostridia bacterium]|nr:helix-turn-helix transcriptional regulator [Clostridia bacterium]MBR2985284.1 helix-turn-helix transcriptional regulator [Clostridia bacterium]
MLKLRELRENRQLSMAQLAIVIGVSDAAISNWENGVNEPKASYLIKLADYFGVTADELLGREDYGTGNVVIQGTQLSAFDERLLQVVHMLTLEDQYQVLGFAQALAK